VYFSGRVIAVIYEDVSQAFYILKMAIDPPDDSEPDPIGLRPKLNATVRGHIPGMTVKIGTWVGFDAKWTDHAEYGRQLVIQKAPVLKNGWSAHTAEKALAASGVGERLLQQIKDHVGEADFVAALGDEQKLNDVPGFDSFMTMFVLQKWQTVRAYFQAMSFLGDLGLPSGRIRQVWSMFGDDAEKVLSTNPWQLVRVDGISFKQADEIAMRLGLGQSNPERVRGAILYTCKERMSAGHLFMSTGQLYAEVSSIIPDLTTDGMGKVLAECHKAGLLVIDRGTRAGTTAIYDPWFWQLEKDSAAMLVARQTEAQFSPGSVGNQDPLSYRHRLASVGPRTEKLAKKKKTPLEKVVSNAVEEWGEAQQLVLSENQKRGVYNALLEPVSILTGLPGTGKTTSLKAVVRILQDAGVRFLLCAPTGIAAKNLANLTGSVASTIHRAFAAKGISEEKRETTYAGVVGDGDANVADGGKDEKWGYGPACPYPAEVVIVDEASMLDQHLLYRLLTCTAPGCRMVIVGDAAQLPSVGPGNVLRDLIRSGRFPVVNLTEIFRQKDTSAIVYAAHAIFRGDMPDCDTTDFKLVPSSGDDDAQQIILKLAQKLYERRANFQILSPRHAGAVGVTTLNAKLRELLNPQRPGLQEIKLGEEPIREDDRIMIVRNDYDLGVFNGDVGKVTRVDRKAKEVEFKIHGEGSLHIRVPFKSVPSLVRLAYACTVHKAQGLEYDVIVMPLVDNFRHQLQRNLLYTAVTRGKTKVILVGTRSALALAVANDKEDQRNTLLKDRLLIKNPD